MIPGIEVDYTDGVSFLLRQLGHHSHVMFSEQIAAIKLTPPHAGILRAIAAEPGRNQRALGEDLGVLPSRLVAYLDELEGAGYIERRRSNLDRRQYALYLTPEGKKLMRKLSGFARRHEDQMIVGLTPEQRDTLHGLLSTIAKQQGLTPHVHPGFRGSDAWGKPPKPDRHPTQPPTPAGTVLN